MSNSMVIAWTPTSVTVCNDNKDLTVTEFTIEVCSTADPGRMTGSGAERGFRLPQVEEQELGFRMRDDVDRGGALNLSAIAGPESFAVDVELARYDLDEDLAVIARLVGKGLAGFEYARIQVYVLVDGHRSFTAIA